MPVAQFSLSPDVGPFSPQSFTEKSALASTFATKQSKPFGGRRLQAWQLLVAVGVGTYLTLGAVTQTLRVYHWFMLLAIPAALLSAERGRRFFIDWLPLFFFWLGYDRLRLIQPHLLSRVSVDLPYEIERQLFGWMGAGEVPAHAARTWLAAGAGTFLSDGISFAAQLVYFSHILIFPGLMLYWWTKSAFFKSGRERFTRYLIAFTILHAMAILCYLVLPVAPPWWVSLLGEIRPTAELVAQVDMAAAMDGALVQRMIQTAPMWFGAVPSLHGAYPALFFLLALRERKTWLLGAIAVYGLAMWAATVVLNQHYIIDLFAGAFFALAAYLLGARLERYRRRSD